MLVKMQSKPTQKQDIIAANHDPPLPHLRKDRAAHATSIIEASFNKIWYCWDDARGEGKRVDWHGPLQRPGGTTGRLLSDVGL